MGGVFLISQESNRKILVYNWIKKWQYTNQQDDNNRPMYHHVIFHYISNKTANVYLLLFMCQKSS